MNVEVLRHLWLANRARQRIHRPLVDGPGAVCAGCWRLDLVSAYPCDERRHADLALEIWRTKAPDGVRGAIWCGPIRRRRMTIG